MKQQTAFLVLENGNVYKGKSFGFLAKESFGEIVFNTSHSGYQETLTDPSYYKQMITFTYPLIGNYGTSSKFMQSDRVYASGLIVAEYSKHFSACSLDTKSLDEFLNEYKITGIEAVDTRKITKTIRESGAMRSGIFLDDSYKSSFLEKVKSVTPMDSLDLAKEVTIKEPYDFNSSGKYKLAVFDFGIKRKILELLSENNFHVRVYPADYEVGNLSDFDAVFFSNGPGDPKAVTYGIENAKKILKLGKPIFGICLGFQIISLALGFKTQKMKFGHRGANQPVKDLLSNKTKMTSQNHGFEVLLDMNANTNDFEMLHMNLNDNTTEGIKGKTLPLLAVQYHPESCPGPNDTRFLFKDFFQITNFYYNR